jgi:TonB family protein
MNTRQLIFLIVYCITTSFAQAQQSDSTENKETKTKATQIVGPFTIVDQMPEFPGGKEALQQFIGKNLKYPNDAFERKVSGQVITKFIVTKNGDIKEVSVLRGVCMSLDYAALRLVRKMPKWEPGILKGEAVDVYFTLPIQFDYVGYANINEDATKADNQTNSPLYIIDGIESTPDEYKAINKSGIKSFVFLVPEKAKKQYGENGKNGTIVIEMKK